MKFLKTPLLVFGMLLLGLFSYGGLEFFEIKKLVRTTLTNELSSAFYVRHFGNIDGTKTLNDFDKVINHTLHELKKAQNDFNQLTPHTPFAKAVRNDYNQGVQAFESAINQTNSTQSLHALPKLKQDVDKAKQLLLNSRDKVI